MYYFGRAMQKRVLWHLWAAKAQISLRIRAVLSGPSVYANRITGHYRIFQLKASA